MQKTLNSVKKDWFKDRGYLHLTNRINKSEKSKVLSYVSNPIKIKQHRFSPLVFRAINNRRFKFSDELSRRSHKSVNDKGEKENNAKMRPIMYATHIDAHVYSYYAHEIIQPKYEKLLKENQKLDASITAYRRIPTEDEVRFKYNVDFAKDVFDEVKRRKNCCALAFDIKNFFPSLNHKQLKQIWSHVLGTKSLPKDHYNVFKSITNFSYFYYDDLRVRRKGNLDEKKIAKLKNKGKFQLFEDLDDFLESDIQVYKNQKKTDGKIAGIPQGLPISALLANIYMLPFDRQIINELVDKKNCFYRRYSDDLVVICNAKDVTEVEDFVMNEIQKIKLKISPTKTEKFRFITEENQLNCYKIQDNVLIPNAYMQYLGFDFYGNKTLIKSANLSRFYREMKESIKMKDKRVDKVQEKYLIDDRIIYKRKIYRLFSFKGIQSRYLPATKQEFQNGKLVTKEFDRKYRGNFIKYAYRASDIMEAPEIRRQVRRHFKVLKDYIKKFDFDNV
jgi:hypothetical protein